MKKSLLSVGVWVAAATLSGCTTFFHHVAQYNLDAPTGTVQLSGLSTPVSISRDSYGVPFISAQNTEDLTFAVGYASAEDRLAQMVSMNLLARGRLAEMAGEAALSMDIYMRTLGVPQLIEERFKSLSPELRRYLESYAKGVNAYIETHKNRLPMELELNRYTPEPWEASNTIGLFVLLNLGVGFNLHEELAFLQLAEKLGTEKAAYLAPIYPDEPIDFKEANKIQGLNLAMQTMAPDLAFLNQVSEQFKNLQGQGLAASNNWVVHKSKTKNAASLLANDTHLLLSQPATWMLMGVKSPEYSGVGVGLPGIPALVAGYNGHIGWGETMVMADTQDLFLEKLRTGSAGQTQYLYQGQWRDVEERVETIKVRDEDDVLIKVQSTVHGPLLNAALNAPAKHTLIGMKTQSPYGLALSWTAKYPDNTMDAFFNLGKAKNIQEAQRALNEVRFIHLNMAVADKDNILWQITGNYPVRKKGTGHFPNPGWEGEYDWQQAWGGAHTPRVLNPDQGFVTTGNNRTVEAGFTPTLTSSWYYPERAERSTQMLQARNDHDAQSMIDMQADRTDLLVAKVQRLWQSPKWYVQIEQGLDSLNEKEREQAQLALEVIRTFSGDMAPESRAAAIWGAFEYQLTRAIFLDELGPQDSPLWRAFMAMNGRAYSGYQDHLLGRETAKGDFAPFWDDVRTIEVEQPGVIIAKALASVWPYLSAAQGEDSTQWQWGKLAYYHWQSETTHMRPYLSGVKKLGAGWLADYTDKGPYPAGGNRNTLNVAGYDLGSDYRVWNIPAMRLVVDFSEAEPLRLVIAGGQSGNPASHHYEDGIMLWLSRLNRTLPFNSADQVKAHYRQEKVLEPK